MTAPHPHRPPAGPNRRRWPLSRIIGAVVLVISVFSVAAMVAGGLAITQLNQQRDKVENTIDGAALATQDLSSALLNQETGLRGYALSAKASFLAPYTQGLAAENTAVASLRPLVAALPAPATADLNEIVADAASWRSRYAEPTIKQIAASGKPVISPDIRTGKTAFDALRARLTVFETDVSRTRTHAVNKLNDAADTLDVVLLAVAVGLVVTVGLLAVGLRRAAVRPVHQIAAQARRVADGDFAHEVVAAGPREVTDLAVDVNRMRVRILTELSALREANDALEAQTADLQRSNTELEQFAYVASHDLQEPLRKVASFCQLLQRRYGGQLDERADQYIGFAVDGAKRMQVLINDLLAFSRVGRVAAETSPVSCDAALGEARANLEDRISEFGATIEAGPLPVVLAHLPLLTAIFQNLISNAIKFRGDQPPHVTISAVRDGEFWSFSVADNGIGISSEYADRVFVIFQRLHDRATYPGTGIGLAMCRKIVEYFGGQIWLEPGAAQGALFRFTLPVHPEYPELPGSSVLAGMCENQEPDD